MKRSTYDKTSAVDPLLNPPDFSNSPEIKLILKSDGKYEPVAQLYSFTQISMSTV